MMMFIGRPLCLPLVLVSGDFSGATFMNMRIAYQKAQDNWIGEQNGSLVPLARRAWRWNIDRNLAAGKLDLAWLKDPDQKYNIDPIPRKWPYVDPEKEANAHKIQLKENRTISRKEICAGEGREYDEVEAQLVKEEAAMPEPVPAPVKPGEKTPEKDAKNDEKDNDSK
jgi:capsid protein